MSSYTTSVMNVRHHDHIDIPSVQYDERVLAREKLANSVGNETIVPFELSVNPTPLGLMGFAITVFVTPMTKTGMVVHVPVISVGACLTSGFLSQIIAGILEIRIGNSECMVRWYFGQMGMHRLMVYA
jgi:succinate-acetate transporter protein